MWGRAAAKAEEVRTRLQHQVDEHGDPKVVDVLSRAYCGLTSVKPKRRGESWRAEVRPGPFSRLSNRASSSMIDAGDGGGSPARWRLHRAMPVAPGNR